VGSDPKIRVREREGEQIPPRVAKINGIYPKAGNGISRNEGFWRFDFDWIVFY